MSDEDNIPKMTKSITQTLSEANTNDLDTCAAALDDLVTFEMGKKVPSSRINEAFDVLLEKSADERKIIRAKSVFAISELTQRNSVTDEKIMSLMDNLIDKSSLVLGMDEDVMTLLINKASSGSNLKIQQYALEGIRKYAESNSISSAFSSTITEFLVSIKDPNLRDVALDGIAQLAKFNKIKPENFFNVFTHLIQNLSTDSPVHTQDKALDAVNALFLKEDPDASESLFRITDDQETDPNDFHPVFPPAQYEHMIDMFALHLSNGGADGVYSKKYLDILAALVLFASKNEATAPLPEKLIRKVYNACYSQCTDTTRNDIKQASILTIACLGVCKLPSSLADHALTLFLAANRADEKTKKRSNRGSPKGADSTPNEGDSTKVTAEQQTAYDHAHMLVSVALKGFATLLIHHNIASEEKRQEVVEIILQRTALQEEAEGTAHGFNTVVIGYLTSCAFLGVRRVMELGLLPHDRVAGEVLDTLIAGADYDQNIYGRSRSSARLALAELVKTGHYAKDKKAELLSILTTKKEKGFSDHNLKPTPKEHLVSQAIEILHSHE